MDTDGGKKRIRLTERVQFRFVLSFAALLALLLIFLNTYPLIAARDMVFSEKESSLLSQTSVVSSSLSALDSLSASSTGQVLDLLDLSDLTRILVTDSSGLVIFDTATPAQTGKYAMLSEIDRALGGEQIFWSRFTGDAFNSRSAMPVVARGVTTGAVYLCDTDSSQAELIMSLQSLLRIISVVACAATLLLAALFSRTLTSRITRLSGAMSAVRGGDYGHRVELSGSDELTELCDDFNHLTERLESTEQQRRRFVSDASHELKTPLAAIRLLSDSIAHSEDMDESTMREFVTDIGTEADRLQRTTEKLLDLSRRDDGIRPDLHPTDVGGVAQSTLRMLLPLAEQCGVAINYEPPEGCFILGTEDEVYQIVFNLAENAVKYNTAGGRVDIRVSCGDGKVRLSVEDTGIGIPETDMPHIFSRFYRVDKARSRERGGSGLGLSIVHDAVSALGGEIEAAARVGGGSRFTVTFPEWDGEERVK